MRKLPLYFASIALFATSAFAAQPSVKVPTIFSDHMVLQAGRTFPVWGTAAPGQRVTVSIAGQTKAVETGPDGKWRISLDPLSPGGPLTLKIEGDKVLTVEDVLVGEVWLCSGQSNMALPVSKAKDFEIEQPAANFPKIRMFQSGNKWVVCSPETVGTFSAIGYFFGRDVHQKTGQSVGLINVSSGGTLIELWTSQEAQKAVPELAWIFQSADAAPATDENAAQAEIDRKRAAAVEGKKAVAGKKAGPGYLFESRILPLIPYAMRGVIWYQGEANSYTNKANLYGLQLATLIKDWRARWGYEFPFIAVQLPELGKPQVAPLEESGRAWVRDGVLETLKMPQVGMAVTLGTGEQGNNHPKNKQEAGRRLALWALAEVYGKKNTPGSGPLVAGSKIHDENVVVTFSHAEGGLAARSGAELKGFAVKNENGTWAWARARIEGNEVIVFSPEVKKPVAACYAWAGNPEESNLVNGAGLPASPFRTDR